MTNSANITLAKQIECVAREIGMRHQVYAGRVAKKRMTQKEMDREIAEMTAALNTLKALDIEGKGTLFGQQLSVEGVIQEWRVSLVPELEQKLLAAGKLKQPPNVKAIYVNGFLSAIVNIESTSAEATKTYFGLPVFNWIRSMDTEPPHMHYVYELLDTATTQQKIAAFCTVFEGQFNRKYKVEGKEAKAWKSKEFEEVPADLPTLEFYMATTDFPISGPKNITDYLRHHQSIIQLIERHQEGPNGKWTFPSYFDKMMLDDLARRNPPQYQAYRTHLKGLGFVRTANPATGEHWKLVNKE